MESSNILDETEKLLKEIFELGQYVLSKLPIEESHPALTFFMINYFERIVYSLDTVRILIPIYKRNSNYETSIGLILRTSLLDFMTITYLSSVEIKRPNSSDTEIHKIIADQIDKTIKYLKTVKNKGAITIKQFQIAIKNLFDTYPFLFSQYDLEHLDKKIKYKFVSPAGMFTHIFDTPQTRPFANAYDTYNYYSKYEHFGIQTHQIQRRGEIECISMMTIAINYSLQGLGLRHKKLSYKPRLILTPFGDH